MNIKNKTLFELNQIGFGYYLKRLPKPKLIKMSSPIKKELKKQIGREPTLKELEKYIALVILPIGDTNYRKKKIKNLIRLVKKNDKEQETRRFSNPHKLHVS